MRAFLWFTTFCMLIANVFSQEYLTNYVFEESEDLISGDNIQYTDGSGGLNVMYYDNDGNECRVNIDLIILLDGSNSVGDDNFLKVKNWVKEVARLMDIERGLVQIGVVQYSHYFNSRPLDKQPWIRTEIALGQYTMLDRFDQAVDNIEYMNFTTYTAHAINKTLDEDFVNKETNRYPDAKRILVLLTDGKAKDSDDLAAVVQKAEHDFGVNMYAIGVGNYNLHELQIITNNHSHRIFELKGFDELNDIVISLGRKVYEGCDCDRRGVIDNECDQCTRQCNCKSNVIGKRCDECDVNHYGITNENGCKPCDCHLIGSTNTSCDADTGQCDCVDNVAGRKCDQCRNGTYGTLPKCIPCDCNGFSDACDPETGQCLDCKGGRIGKHCEKCPSGEYFDQELESCTACQCNEHIDVEDPESCDPVTGRCLKCLHNTAGDKCEQCKDFYYGDASTSSCEPCSCNVDGTVEEDCFGTECRCDKVTGQCPCHPNVKGKRCDRCSPGHWGLESLGRCQSCSCNKVGTVPGTDCSADTGTCECEVEYAGVKCDRCADGYERKNGEQTCSEPVPTIATTTVKTTTTTTAPEPTTTTAAPEPTTTTAAPEPTPPEITSSTTHKATTTRRATPRTKRPCFSCGSLWPSYCMGWYCRRRWPYHQFYPSASGKRCYSWNWNCRATAQYYRNQNRDSQIYNSRPRYYRGYYHHSRPNRPPVRYNLYKN